VQRKADVKQVDVRDLDNLVIEQTVGYALFVLDAHGTVLTWNPGAEATFGWTKDEALGRHYEFLFTPEDGKAGVPRQKLMAITKDGSAGDECWYVRKDGARVWINGLVTALRDASGKPAGFSVIMRDDTHAQRLQERVRQSEERFRLISEALPDTAWTTTYDGSLDFMNARWNLYTGAPVEQALGMGWFAFLHPQDRQATVEAWQKAMDTSQPYEVEHRFRMNDGSFRWFLSRALPILGADGHAVRWVGTSTDIHEQRLTALRLARREQQQAVVVALGRYALAGHTLSELCQEAVNCVREILQSDYAKILSYHPGGPILRLEASAGLLPDEAGKATVEVQGTAAGHSVLTGQPVVVEDFGMNTPFKRSELLQAHGVRSCVTAPIIGTDTPYGVLVTGSTEAARFLSEDVTYLQAVANIIGEALSRQVLEEERRRLLLEHLLEEQLEQERRRVGRELHDGIRQQLVGVKMLATLLKSGWSNRVRRTCRSCRSSAIFWGRRTIRCGN
jgi:PAS domain S-box-containing protein